MAHIIGNTSGPGGVQVRSPKAESKLSGNAAATGSTEGDGALARAEGGVGFCLQSKQL